MGIHFRDDDLAENRLLNLICQHACARKRLLGPTVCSKNHFMMSVRSSVHTFILHRGIVNFPLRQRWNAVKYCLQPNAVANGLREAQVWKLREHQISAVNLLDEHVLFSSVYRDVTNV